MSTSQPRQRRQGPLGRLVAVLTAIEIVIGSIAILAILVLVFMQAAQRYTPFDGFAWTGELAKFSMIWLSFSVIGVLITTRGHIALEIVDSVKNPMVVRVVQALALVIVAIVGLGLTVEAWGLVSTQAIIKSPVLRLPMSLVYVPVLVGVISLTIRSTIAALDVAIHGPKLSDYDELESEVAA
ncbi:TRAP transporter small permease subunit [Salinibacterium sp. dk2585]|uniref:TRAP transporter small permease n=1 Tax=unclassified Salinibacterium TaxID=2632331 RepID=UPI0011C24B26|nr:MULTISPECIES: TRAP transporter small permease subunit [unclassified Salinibacterium]QEE60747.1 TRAP transporter small permease subunit [Salinibacterium sp. dk2585]TXK55819.1 TRAP transporter small permease subunit [Salinibacterium sp. dk5596]